MKKESYIVLDIETTGLSRDKHKITEIAAIKVNSNKIIDKFETLINPQVNIPSFITSLTGISNSMVKNSPIIEEILPNFLRFVKQDPLIAHCASFDYNFLNHNSELHLSSRLQNPKICTRKLSRRLVNLESYRLSSLCNHFNIINSQAHRAMADVQATNQVFTKLLGLMESKGIKEKQQILEFQDKKISTIF